MIFLLHEENVRSIIASTLIADQKVKPTPVSIQSLNEVIAKQLNSAKFPIEFFPNESIIPPSIGSKFCMERYNESFIFKHEQFPSDKEFASTEKERLKAYIEFIKKKVNTEQNEDSVKKEFLEFFWAEENVKNLEISLLN